MSSCEISSFSCNPYSGQTVSLGEKKEKTPVKFSIGCGMGSGILSLSFSVLNLTVWTPSYYLVSIEAIIDQRSSCRPFRIVEGG